MLKGTTYYLFLKTYLSRFLKRLQGEGGEREQGAICWLLKLHIIKCWVSYFSICVLLVFSIYLCRTVRENNYKNKRKRREEGKQNIVDYSGRTLLNVGVHACLFAFYLCLKTYLSRFLERLQGEGEGNGRVRKGRGGKGRGGGRREGSREGMKPSRNPC